MNEQTSTTIDTHASLLASKVKEIIESQWGKSLADVKDLNVDRLYKRLVQNNRVSYEPTDRYILDVQFFTSRWPRRATFHLLA